MKILYISRKSPTNWSQHHQDKMRVSESENRLADLIDQGLAL